MRRLFATALLIAATAALPVRAQVLLRWPATTDPATETTVPADSAPASTLLPVLNRTTGDFEAFLLVEPWAAAAVPGLDGLANGLGHVPRPSDGLSLLDLSSDNLGVRLRAGLHLDSSNNVALLCDGPSGLPQSLDGLSRHCALATLDAADDPLLRYAPLIGAGLNIDAGSFRLDLDASATRLSLGTHGSTDRRVYPGISLLSGASGDRWFKRPSLAQSLTGLRLDQVDISGNAVFRIGEQGWLSIAGSVARARLITNTNTLFRNGEWIRRDLGLTGGWGAFSGYIGGHRLSGLDGNRVFGLDLGVSWRTPWNGLLSVGAENLLSSGDSRTGPGQTGLPDETQGSTPYVRYRQDL